MDKKLLWNRNKTEIELTKKTSFKTWCSPRINVRTSPICFIWKRSKKCFKPPRTYYVCRRGKFLLRSLHFALANSQGLTNLNESQNAKKTKYSFFQKLCTKDSIFPWLPNLTLSNDKLKRKERGTGEGGGGGGLYNPLNITNILSHKNFIADDI